MTVYLTAIFEFNGPLFLHQKGYNYGIVKLVSNDIIVSFLV